METLDLKDFERQMVVRSLTLDDYDALVAMHLKYLPRLEPWSRAQIETQLAIFPDGQMGVEIDVSPYGPTIPLAKPALLRDQLDCPLV